MNTIERNRKPVSSRASAAPRTGDLLSGGALSLVLVLAIFFLVSLMWALFIPIPAPRIDAAHWDGYHPDEHIHSRFLVYLARHHALPPFGPPGTDVIYTAVHPPLYHLGAALVYAALAPFLGHVPALLALRVAGCLIGTGTVWLAYRTARYLLPHNTALLAAGCVAGVPMFVSLSAAVSNEVPAAFLASGALCTMAAGLRHGFAGEGPGRRRLLALSAWVAAAVATKVTCLTLLPAAFLSLVLARRRRPRGGPGIAGQMLTVAGVCVAATGWWFVRNQILYGDPLIAAAHQRLWNPAGSASWQRLMNLPQFFWNTAFSGWRSFWGVFDAFSRPMLDPAYYTILLIQVPAVVGFVWFVKRGKLRGTRLKAALVLGVFSALLIALFFALNGRIYSPQGRYLFPLLVPFGLVTATGWMALFGRRLRGGVTCALLLVLLLLNLFAFATMSVRPEKHAGWSGYAASSVLPGTPSAAAAA